MCCRRRSYSLRSIALGRRTFNQFCGRSLRHRDSGDDASLGAGRIRSTNLNPGGGIFVRTSQQCETSGATGPLEVRRARYARRTGILARSTSVNEFDHPIIRLENVTKVFLTDEVETHALSGIQLEISRGQFVSIAGPSGCGKSTLLSILGLLDSPSEGEYALNEKPVENLSLSERARIRNREVGFIFQSFNLIGDLTVYENVELPLTYRGMNSSDRKQRVTAALERVGMAHRAKHLPSQLSGGQQQRVAVARAVGGQPSILLADEPTGNLDSTNGEAVMELLRELHRGGATICMVTHDPRYAQHADRIVHLFDGLIVEEEAGANRREVEEAKRALEESGFGASG